MITSLSDILRRIIWKINGTCIFRACALSSPQAFPPSLERPGNEARNPYNYALSNSWNFSFTCLLSLTLGAHARRVLYLVCMSVSVWLFSCFWPPRATMPPTRYTSSFSGTRKGCFLLNILRSGVTVILILPA